ncbi:bifunctional polysaccharide deacetylase/glycosyltransferase family 2 protein [Streptomyces fuscigenes]|uniref:bifunctional polysaccharide deacetylase/glycosyltransferase family 2 protein n=1 Tax=Streptomyces fuscigenes TaxID=1528880 RepID=UPI001F3FF88D|nr:bifunctional polysaccharide deacetylase/glycosyltransferase family 2 protein [Streptomyces fuscigenes]MCF3964900.1 bifunctional polysaccharide deacetylase/glycosyltransferase family 2 protein [Streptomyces fuscigenes]
MAPNDNRARRSAGRGARRRRLPLRHLLPIALLLVMSGMLVVRGYVYSSFVPDHRVRPPASTSHVPEHILDGGPVIDARDASKPAKSLDIPDRTIVLTFDDGPDPVWTPKILDILHANGAKATFFVTGTNTARHPGLVKRMVAEGNEVGIHTFDHPDLSYLDPSTIRREISQTQLTIEGAAGVRTALFRPPYSSFADALDNASWPVTQYVGSLGYIGVFDSLDSEDWQRPGVARITANATPRGSRGAVVLMHDFGGDRSQTVRALADYIRTMHAKGYRFETVTGALHAPSAHTPVHGTDLLKGKAFVAAVTLSDNVTEGLIGCIAFVGVLVVGRFALMLLLAFVHARRSRRRRRTGAGAPPAVTQPVSVLVPAYNESKCIANTVRSLARSDHPIEVVVIDDGSSDGTADIVEAMWLPNVRVIRQQNAGKPAALNNGIRHARHDLIVMMDGDTVFEESTVRELVQPFADPRVGAVSGNAKVGNRDSLIGAWQHIEYVMGFNLDRRMYDLLRCMPTIPGACGAFRREVLREVGGMSEDTLAEDTDITMAIHRKGWEVVYAEDARAWTEAPESVQQLWSQRYRWCYGTMQAMWKHRRAVVERGPSGRFGRVGLPFVAAFMVVAPLLAPLIDLFLLYGLVFGPTGKTVASWLVLLAIQLVCAVYAFRLDREPMRHLLALPLQQILYRALMYVVLVQSWVTALTGGRLRWQKLRRTGVVEAAPPAAPPRERAAGRGPVA